MKTRCLVLVAIAISVVGLGSAAASASAEAIPVWKLSVTAFPTRFEPETEDIQGAGPGYLLVATNIGSGEMSGDFTVSDTLPAGVVPLQGKFINKEGHTVTITPQGEYGQEKAPQVLKCTVVSEVVTCTGATGSVESGGKVKVLIPVKLESGIPQVVTNLASVSGGGAAPVSRELQTEVGSTPAPFDFRQGSEGFNDLVTDSEGNPQTQAGAHPYQMSIDLNFNIVPGAEGKGEPLPAGGGLRDATVSLPSGMVVDPIAMPRCSEAELELPSSCKVDTQIGTVRLQIGISGLNIGTRPLYNMVAPPGTPGEFGFEVVTGTYVHFTGHLDSAGTYQLSAGASDILAKVGVYGVETTLWGVPSDPAHDKQRGLCVTSATLNQTCSVESVDVPFLSMPSACSGPITTSALADSWNEPTQKIFRTSESADLEGNPVGVEGCNALRFSPAVSSKVTTNQGESPSGLDFDLHQPQPPAVRRGVGTTEICGSGGWSAATSLSYKWLSGGAPIAGATSRTYTPGTADEGAAVQCEVTGEVSAEASGDVTAGSDIVKAVETLSGSVAVGEAISGPGIAAGSTVAAVAVESPGFSEITLSRPATQSGTDVVLSTVGRLRAVSLPRVIPPGPSVELPAASKSPSIKVGTAQTLTVSATAGSYTLTYRGQTSAPLAFDATATEIREALEALSTVGNGGVEVSGAGSPFEIVFENQIGSTLIAAASDAGEPLSGGSAEVTWRTTAACEPGIWSGTPTFAYAWLANGEALAGQSEATFSSDAGEVPLTLQCLVTATNAGGSVADLSPSATATAPAGGSPLQSTARPAVSFPESDYPLANANLKNTTVTLPEGTVLNPSAANGREACSAAQIGLTTAIGATPVHFDEEPQSCPDAAKIGTVEIDTPLLDHPLPGSVYLAEPFDNPFDSLLGIYLAIEDEQSGVVAKLAGKVSADPSSGQLTTRFEESPDLPLEDVVLHLFNGARAPLTTPIACGTHTTTSTLTPWSTPEGQDVHPSDSFETTAGCYGSEAAAPTGYSFVAGTESPLAGAFSPFVLHLSRKDGTQHITGIETTLPEGLVGKAAGVPYCPESAIAQARSREAPEMGKAEIDSPSCPAASQVGTVNVTAGSGITPIPVSGHAYWAGPYKGAPLSVVVIVPAVAGPFDLGTVVDRVAVYVGEYDARIRAVADPLPTIRDGIPLDVRSIELKLDKPSFTLNPTSCEATAIEGTVTTQPGQSVALKNHFQVGECGRLPFKPKLSLSLKGPTKRTGHPALKAVLTMPPGSANLKSVQVGLPHSEFLDQSNIGEVCTQANLKADTCPPGSIYGRAKAWTPLLDAPLQGPVYLGVGFGHKLPDLVVDLNGQIRILAHGRVDTTKQHGLRNTFEFVPDAPVEKFVLEMKGGKKYGLLVNSENVCAKGQKARAAFTAQNGKATSGTVKIANSCKGGSKGSKKGSKKH